MKHIAYAAAFASMPASAFAVDTCLQGNWDANPAQIGREIAAVMGGNITYRSGSVLMTINSVGTLTMNIDGLTFRVQTPGAPEFDMTISGYSEGTLLDEGGGAFRTNITGWELDARANIMGTVMQVPTTGFGDVWGHAIGSYSCNGDSLNFVTIQEGTMPRDWRRQ